MFEKEINEKLIYKELIDDKDFIYINNNNTNNNNENYSDNNYNDNYILI